MTYYVNAKAKFNGNGSKTAPFKTINEAAALARAGDEVIVAPGIYREQVIPRSGGSEDKRIVYKSEKPLGAVISGAEVLKGWKKYKGDVWTAKVDNGIFGGYNPYTTYVCGDWYFAATVRHTGSVILNDRMMYETTSLEECLEGRQTLAPGTRRNLNSNGTASRKEKLRNSSIMMTAPAQKNM